LSGGQQQRIALARALVFEPELVLMDEPLGALDKQLREHMQFEITNLAHQLGITTVYVTHDQTEALTMSDRVAVFDDGRIQQLAPPDELYESPQNSFVAQFIGENNTLAGTVSKIKGGHRRGDARRWRDDRQVPVNVSQSGERTTSRSGPNGSNTTRTACQQGRAHAQCRGAGVHLHGRHLPHAAARGGQGRLHHQDTQRPRSAPAEPGEKIEIGWQPQDCRALDA
jgi:putative spermidine/putrescine transport system ATP-binding protein